MIDITLNNGVVMPALGLGVFQTRPEGGDDGGRGLVGRGLEDAEAGGRHLDAVVQGDGGNAHATTLGPGP